jgi:hypothetical protein
MPSMARLVITGLFLLPACRQRSEAIPIMESHERISSETVKHLSNQEKSELEKAFLEAFGLLPPATVAAVDEGATRDEYLSEGAPTLNPVALFKLTADRWVLISSATWKGGHTDAGYWTVQYLSKRGGQYRPVGKSDEVGGGAYYGVVSPWELRYDLGPHPVMVTHIDDAHMGTAWARTGIVALSPKGATVSADFISYYAQFSDKTLDRLGDKFDYDTSTPDCALKGEIVPKPARSGFDVVYSGKLSRIDQYKLEGQNYVLLGSSKPIDWDVC